MAKSRKVSSISREFDGKEVQGKLIERSGLFGSKVSKEVFKMPGGGKHIEKTRTNKKGDVVSRLSRDTKVNPLTVFNKNKEKAIKKAGGEMSKYKKSLKRFQGNVTGSQVTSAASDSTNKINMSNNTYNTERANARKLMEEYYKKADNEAAKKILNNSSVPIPGLEIPSSTKTPIQGAYDEYKTFKMSQSKKGGSVKRKRK